MAPLKKPMNIFNDGCTSGSSASAFAKAHTGIAYPRIASPVPCT